MESLRESDLIKFRIVGVSSKLDEHLPNIPYKVEKSTDIGEMLEDYSNEMKEDPGQFVFVLGLFGRKIEGGQALEKLRMENNDTIFASRRRGTEASPCHVCELRYGLGTFARKDDCVFKLGSKDDYCALKQRGKDDCALKQRGKDNCALKQRGKDDCALKQESKDDGRALKQEVSHEDLSDKPGNSKTDEDVIARTKNFVESNGNLAKKEEGLQIEDLNEKK